MENRNTWNSDKIVSVSAIMISLMTLFVSVYQTTITRKQQRLSVFPYLSQGNYNTGGADYKLIIANNGIGPAFIEKISVRYKNKEYEVDLPTFLAKHIPEFKEVKHKSYSNIFPGQMIPAGVTVSVFSIKNSVEDGKRLVKLLDKLDKEGMTVSIIYKSVYDEHWKLVSGSYTPEKL